MPSLPERLNARLDHIAVAVRSIESSTAIYRAIGGVMAARERVLEQGVDVLPIEFGGARIELLEPVTPDSPVGRYLARRGEGLHHIAVRVDDLAAALVICREAGLKPLHDEPRRGAEGRLILFLDPRTTGGVLIELTQYPE